MSDIIKETEEKDAIEEKDIGKILSLLSYFHEEKTNKVYIIDTYSYPFYLLTLFFRSRFPIIAYELKQKATKDEEYKTEKSKPLSPLAILLIPFARVFLVKFNNSLTPTDIDIYVKALVIVLFLSFMFYRVANKRKQVINSFKSLGIKKYKVRLKKPKLERDELLGFILIVFFIVFLNLLVVGLIIYDNTYIIFLFGMLIGTVGLHIVLKGFTLLGSEIEILKELEY